MIAKICAASLSAEVFDKAIGTTGQLEQKSAQVELACRHL
jgi:hypothetical protein